MQRKTLSDLTKQHRLLRVTLLVSLVFFVIGLIAVILHWDVAVPVIVFACLFRVIVVWLVRRRYNSSWMQVSVTNAAEKKCGPVSYKARETAPDGLAESLGIAPDVQLTPNTLFFHVLRGNLSDLPFRLAETAFVRMGANRRAIASSTVAGSLITVENALPDQEEWTLLINRPLDNFCSLRQYEQSGWKPVPVSSAGAACYSKSGTADSAETACIALSKMMNQQCAVLAATGGKLSLLLPRWFYADKPDMRTPTEEALNRTVIPPLEFMEKLLDDLRKIHSVPDAAEENPQD